MKKTFSRMIASALTVTMLSVGISFNGISAVSAAEPTLAGGWFETVYAQWEDTNPTGATVTCTNTATGETTTLQGEDKQFLQRSVAGGSARVDIPGLKAGIYKLTITSSTGTVYEKDGIEVMPNDRSGYAHFNYSEGVGAYKNDGTLKENAKVIYVTDENKDTVTVSSSDGTTVSGIGNILNSAGGHPKTKTDKNGKVTILSDVINTNQDIIKKLALDGTPLVVRFIGSVTAPQGLTAYDSNDYGGTVGDNGFMARMQSGKDITLEGIGYDAQLKGWGIHYMCQSSAPDLGKSFEARNLTFWGAPEDALGMEGIQSGDTITAPVERVWVHHCSFLPQPISNPAESDKSEGDGCCDFKRGQYMTMSYCYFYNAHKTNLVGSSDSSLQYHITWHHNMWEKCEARGPLGRNANMHIYNNYYKNQTSYAMNPRANCYIFSEYNTMEYCKNPMQIKSGAIKSYNDTLIGCSNAIDGTFVTDKNEKVSSANKYASFELDSAISYIPGGNYELTENAAQAKAACVAYAGAMKEQVVDASQVDISMIQKEHIPENAVTLPYSASYGKTADAFGNNPVAVGAQTINNVYYNPTKLDTDNMTIKDSGIIFKVDRRAKITMTGKDATYDPVLYDNEGRTLINLSGQAIVEPGVYIIQSGGFDAGKQVFKEAKIMSLEIVAANPDETISTTETSTETTTNNTGESTETTTFADYDGQGLIWNYTDGANTLNAVVDGDEWSNAQPVSYNGATFTAAIKMESSTNISFNVPKKGRLTIVSASDKAEPYLMLNDVSTPISTDGAVTIEVQPGDMSITRGSTSTGIYMLEFVPDKETLTDYVKGDADYSGVLTSNDAASILKKTLDSGYVTELEKAGANSIEALDVNGDSIITSDDAAMVLTKVLG